MKERVKCQQKSDSVIAYNCGVCADKIKKPEEALKYFDIAIQKKYNLGNAYVGKAGALKDLKKDSEYLATLKEGIEAAPENKTLKRLHANYYLNAGIKAKESSGRDKVALSGGVFQNRLLLRLTEERLLQEGFEVLRHRMIPPNDGGIAIGQAAYGMYQLQK